MTNTPQTQTLRVPATPAGRALAPDLARGAMLLFIALANSANVAFAGQPGIDPAPTGAGRVLNAFLLTFVDSRAYPVFAVMFGYGLVQLARRHSAAGADPRPVLLRRNAWLVGFGLAHATLLYFGDFLGAYGVIGVLATLLLLRRGDRFHRIVLWLWGATLGYALVLGVLLAVRLGGDTGGHATLTNSPNPSLAATTYGRSLLDRLAEWPAHTATVIPVIVIVWLGMWAARRRLLEDAAAHVALLRRVAVGCLAVTVAGAVPYALVGAGLVDVEPGTVDLMALVHAVSGEFGGPGYVALFALLALRFGRAGTPWVGVLAVSALGRRSMSGYLFQSVAWMALLSPWALDLGRHGGTAFVAAGIAVAVWLISVAVAWRLDVRGVQGPAETLLRRLAYGPRVRV
ncbi:DUF418 domain-containing protein [Longispora sp. NPDC051575]|uniref:DUF418 domain-containing protein n=1 Tax=Longispora sp. NPDC051575 TaxID=3154943 RepID=UPI003431F8F5